MTSLSGELSPNQPPPIAQERMVEWSIETGKIYSDPFNDVDVDVVFERNGQHWRVPTFWRGRNRWTVRFAPPNPGEYAYHLESTDIANPDLNGHEGRITVTAYSGGNVLLKHGMLRVGSDGRHFEQADGTPFFWLGDTWWTGLSDRLSWGGFQKLTADRVAKGFTVVQIVAGLVPWEELAPVDPGFANEGGPVWDAQFERINPNYFDYADRRIQCLVDNGMVPAIVGGWSVVLSKMGVAKMQKHWRYIIARYGAYPAFWIVGGEVMDPPAEMVNRIPDSWRPKLIVPGWTEVARYIKKTDPYHHPITAHEWASPVDKPFQDESLTDFDMVQSCHFGWPSLALSVAQLDLRYARTSVTKPSVQGEIGYENHKNMHYEDFQRAAFWLSMLNGAAGHTYGADGVFEAYTGDKPLHRIRHSFMSWEEGMNLPGSYQVGLSAKLLKQYSWWRFAPHPEWVTPHGTTLLEPRASLSGTELGSWLESKADESPDNGEIDYPLGEWRAHHGTARRPYAAGIPGEVRIIYIPNSSGPPPTVLGLEPRIRYHAYFWQPSLGIRFDLGAIERPELGALLFEDSLAKPDASRWANHRKREGLSRGGSQSDIGDDFMVETVSSELDAVVTVHAKSASPVALILRYQDPENYVAAVYSPDEKSLYLLDRKNGTDGKALGQTPLPVIGPDIRLLAEVRGDRGAVSITDGHHTYTTSIVKLVNTKGGNVGLIRPMEGSVEACSDFELRRSPVLVKDENLDRELYDAQGHHRGTLAGSAVDDRLIHIPGWDSFGRDKQILLDAYQPQMFPGPGDWILVLESKQASPSE